MSSNGEVPTLVVTGAHPRLYNHDLAPTAPEGRTWGVFSLFAMWMSDVHSVGGYTFAASLFFLGLTGWQVLISMLVGITAVYFLMNLIGRPSLRYGIPFPVVARISFGVMGANLAAIVRGVVGIVWYGVQTYFASKAVQVLVITLAPSAADLTHNSILGLSTLAWISFLFMWVFQLVIFLSGMERIRKFIDFCGPVVYVVMFAMAIWMLWQSGFSSLALQLSPPAASNVATIGVMANAAMLIVAYFCGVAAQLRRLRPLRQGREGTMKTGNLLGLPLNFLVFSIITVIVTAGTLKVFGQAIMDPVLIVEKIGNPVVVILGSITFIVATMGINIVANFVSPAYDISNLKPGEDQLQDGRPDHLHPVRAGLPVAVRREPVGHHPVRQHLRLRAGADVRDHARRLLPGEEADHRKVEDLYTMSPSGTFQLRRGLEPQGPDCAGGVRGPVDRPVAAGRLRDHVQRRRLGMVDRGKRGRAGVLRALGTRQPGDGDAGWGVTPRERLSASKRRR